jgi:hypothetical protein
MSPNTAPWFWAGKSQPITALMVGDTSITRTGPSLFSSRQYPCFMPLPQATKNALLVQKPVDAVGRVGP